MNNLKKILCVGLFNLISFNTYADYVAVYPLKDLNIDMISQYESLIGNWINNGESVDCSVWSPAINTIKKGEEFQQTSVCIQKQSRNIQEQVKNESSGIIRPTGKISTENREINVTKTQKNIGTKNTVKTCTYSTSFGGGFWVQRDAKTIYIAWNGTSAQPKEFTTGNIAIATEYVRDGFTYTRGNFQKSTNDGQMYYYICIE